LDRRGALTPYTNDDGGIDTILASDFEGGCPVIVDCAHYREGKRQQAGRMDLDDAAAMCTADAGSGFVWLGMFEPDPEELALVQDRFGLHDLAVEDAQAFHLRPKIESYDDGEILFVVLRTARYVEENEEVEFGEVSVFMSRRFIITVRQGVASDLHGARLRLERRPELLQEGPGAVLWAILDKIVDDYAPVVEGLETDIEEVEQTVFSGSTAPTQRIYDLRREASDFYRAVHPLAAPLDAIERGAYTQLGTELRTYFRDVNDHLKLVDEEVVAQRDLLAVILQANMAVVSVEQTQISVRQNETARQLTLIATIFLPLTFLTGFFGQNFGWLVDHIAPFWAFAVYGLGGLAVSVVALRLFLRRSELS
jgi:magnesium transporter